MAEHCWNHGPASLPCGAGTGKTLSLICSALQWLQDKHARDAAAECAAVAASPSGGLRPCAHVPHMADMRLLCLFQASAAQRYTITPRLLASWPGCFAGYRGQGKEKICPLQPFAADI